MILESLLVYLPALIYGLVLVCLFFPGPVLSNFFLKCALATGIGLGISSCLYLFWCLVFGPAQSGFSLVEWGLAACLSMLLFKVKKDSFTLPPRFQKPPRSAILLAGLPGLLFIFLVPLTLLAYKNYTFMFPHGTFDAYAIWNLKARFIFRDPANWQNAFSPELNWKFHADYPLLLPLNVARAWLQMNIETTRVPIILSGFFLFSILFLMYSGITKLRDTSQAAAAGLLLVAAPWLTFYATTLNAAIPTAYFYLATCITLVLFQKSADWQYLVLSGLLSGLAAWTKNEGQVFLLAVVLMLLLFLQKTPISGFVRKTLSYLAGLVLPLASLFYFKLVMAPANDLFADRTPGDILANLLDISRYLTIFESFSGLFLHLGEWQSPVFVIAIVYLILLGINRSNTLKEILLPAGAILITFLGYASVYLITPHPLDWHLKYSADRLIFHLFPPILFIIFYISKTPIEILQDHQSKRKIKEQT